MSASGYSPLSVIPACQLGVPCQYSILDNGLFPTCELGVPCQLYLTCQFITGLYLLTSAGCSLSVILVYTC